MIQLFDTTQELSTIQAIPFSGFVSGIYQQYGHFAVSTFYLGVLPPSLSTGGYAHNRQHNWHFLGQDLQSTVV